MTTAQPGSQGAYFGWVDDAGNQNWFIFDLVEDEEWDEGAEVTEHPVSKGANISDHVRVQLRKVRIQARATNEPIGANNWDSPSPTSVGLDVPTPTWTPNVGFVLVSTWFSSMAARIGTTDLAGLAFGPKGAIVAGNVGAFSPAGVQANIPYPNDSGLKPPPPRPQIQATVLSFGDDPTDFIEATNDLLVRLKDAAQLVTVYGSKQHIEGLDNMVIETLTTHRSGSTGAAEEITIGFKEVRIVETNTVSAPIPALPRATAPINRGNQAPKPAPPAVQKSVAERTKEAILRAIASTPDSTP